MNQDLMVRLFRSIENGSSDDLVKVAKKIVESEKAKGHSRLANKLKKILESNLKNLSPIKKELTAVLSPEIFIPTDKRSHIPLAVIVPSENLRHEMVLSKDVEENIHRIEREYAARERLALFGLKPRQKILFHGAPGCGKSMGAERIAWNIGLPFLKVRFEAVMSSYLGESASNLRNLFESLKTYPCVLLLDEFDFIAKSRTTAHDVGEMHRIVNILLNLLEDYDAPGLLIATTNLQGTLDEALFRRFDDIIEIRRPGKEEILRLLKQALSSMNVGSGILWSEVVAKMEGFSAAVIVKIANDAAKFAVIQGDKLVGMRHIEKALSENVSYVK